MRPTTAQTPARVSRRCQGGRAPGDLAGLCALQFAR